MERKQMIRLTPYREIRGGEKSIYDYVQEGYTVPDKVLEYLKTTNPYLMSPGVYEHPFKKGKQLLGPYLYTDGHYCWDRDTWKYIVKYHVTVPQEFVDHVMSDAGTEFLRECKQDQRSWANTVKEWKDSEEGGLCLLPDNIGDGELDDF